MGARSGGGGGGRSGGGGAGGGTRASLKDIMANIDTSAARWTGMKGGPGYYAFSIGGKEHFFQAKSLTDAKKQAAVQAQKQGALGAKLLP